MKIILIMEYATGLTGGIVQVPAECKTGTELKNGMGTTVHHFVESIESVCPLLRYDSCISEWIALGVD